MTTGDAKKKPEAFAPGFSFRLVVGWYPASNDY